MAKRGQPPIIIGITMAVEVVFWIGLLFGLPVVTFRKLKREQCHMSTRPYQVQRTLLVSLMVQVSLPALTMALPVVMIVLCLTFVSFDSSDIMILAFQIFSLHSFFNAVATIALTRPYREVVLRWLHLRKRGDKVKVISVVSHNSFTRRASEMANARFAERRISTRPTVTVEA
ncbi:7TM GPCR protein [Aphelenchoides avenae]|nr:7TM GPCR protein [Aphelenchus avenae]